MASVHIVGELLGASGLSCSVGQEAFSVSHLLDLLSLHPSSEFSYYCKWRLVVQDRTKQKNEDPSWRVIQGETRGQTQVHVASSGGSLAMPDLFRHTSGKDHSKLLPKMDTVWAHPIDLHLAVVNIGAWKNWPRLEFQVWRLNRFQLEIPCGTASISLPVNTSEYLLDLPLVLREPKTILGSLARLVGLPYPDSPPRDNEADKTSDLEVIRETGTLYLRVAVLSRGFSAPNN